MAKCGCPWLLLAVFYLCYLLLGAVIVSLIEQPHERRLRAEAQLLKSQLLNSSSSCLTESELERFLARVLEADRYGVSILSNASHKINWDFASSFFFASTLITTVGYGHITPVSDGGKIFSIFFALLGVPLTMLVLSVIVQRLLVVVTYRPISLCQERLGYTEKEVTWLHFLLLLLTVLLTFFLIPAAIFSTIERSWSFLDAFYFCFISLTTIGLGDYVPSEQENQPLRPLYKISITVYLLCGLIMMFLLIQVFHKMAGLHGLTQIFDLPLAEEEEGEEMVLYPGGPIPSLQNNGLKSSQQLQTHHPEPPDYKSILPTIHR